MSHPCRKKLLPLLSVGVLVAAPLDAGADESGISFSGPLLAAKFVF